MCAAVLLHCPLYITSDFEFRWSFNFVCTFDLVGAIVTNDSARNGSPRAEFFLLDMHLVLFETSSLTDMVAFWNGVCSFNSNIRCSSISRLRLVERLLVSKVLLNEIISTVCDFFVNWSFVFEHALQKLFKLCKLAAAKHLLPLAFCCSTRSVDDLYAISRNDELPCLS